MQKLGAGARVLPRIVTILALREDWVAILQVELCEARTQIK
jgi:hypothetical protein